MVRRIDLQQNSVRRVADDYLFSSAALSMFRFHMTHDLRLEMFLKLGAYLKFLQKEALCCLISLWEVLNFFLRKYLE